MIFTASDVSSVAESLSRWELGEYISEAFVAVACTGELVADFGRKCLTGAHRNRVERLSTILLVVSLLASLICLERANVLSGILIGSIRDKAVEADKKASTALTDSGTATTKADEAKTTVAGVANQAHALTLEVEGATRQLDRLEEKIRVQGPRWRLLEDNQATFIESLKPFAGQRFTIVSCAVSPAEQVMLQEGLLSALGKQGAHWLIQTPYAQWKTCVNGGSAIGGNLVIVSSTAEQSVQAAAKALDDALNGIDISTLMYWSSPAGRQVEMKALGADSPWELAEKDPTAVILLVGANPMFDLAGWKKRHKK